jgi:hypothetical protein
VLSKAIDVPKLTGCHDGSLPANLIRILRLFHVARGDICYGNALYLCIYLDYCTKLVCLFVPPSLNRLPLDLMPWHKTCWNLVAIINSQEQSMSKMSISLLRNTVAIAVDDL